ncbi:MAG TPA: hypothetical protein VFA00_10300 [Actinomycetota bacterium]|nr:hypothetical protein [Actinomycetota bacterium]
MKISVINHTSRKVTDEEVQLKLRGINRQIAEDFEPYWGLTGELRLEGRAGRQPNKQEPVDMRGDAVIYLWDEVNVEDALGFHQRNRRGIPYGFVFTELCKELGEDWSVALSHEALELLGDPLCNLLVVGPHPDESKAREVYYWREMCDAVQSETYEIDGVKVSNFVLPLYFTARQEPGGRNDFLGNVYNRRTLRSFGVNPGGYVGFWDPRTKKDGTQFADDKARKRMEIKGKASTARRAVRYKRQGNTR